MVNGSICLMLSRWIYNPSSCEKSLSFKFRLNRSGQTVARSVAMRDLATRGRRPGSRSSDVKIAWGGLILCSALIASIVVIAWSGSDWGRGIFSHLCHQQTDRCLTLGGTAMAVCARWLSNGRTKAITFSRKPGKESRKSASPSPWDPPASQRR